MIPYLFTYSVLMLHLLPLSCTAGGQLPCTLSARAIAGIVVAVLFVAVILPLLCAMLCCCACWCTGVACFAACPPSYARLWVWSVIEEARAPCSHIHTSCLHCSITTYILGFLGTGIRSCSTLYQVRHYRTSRTHTFGVYTCKGIRMYNNIFTCIIA